LLVIESFPVLPIRNDGASSQSRGRPLFDLGREKFRPATTRDVTQSQTPGIAISFRTQRAKFRDRVIPTSRERDDLYPILSPVAARAESSE
jgi:hypothetical protein